MEPIPNEWLGATVLSVMTSPSIASLIIKKESTTSSPPPPSFLLPPLPCDLHTQTPPFTSHHEWKQPQALTRNRCRPHASLIAHRTVSQINLFFLINYPAPGVLPQQHKQTKTLSLSWGHKLLQKRAFKLCIHVDLAILPPGIQPKDYKCTQRYSYTL